MVLTGVGVEITRDSVLPLPNAPLLPPPQQYALSSEAMTQKYELPAVICLIVFPARTPVVLTGVGVEEFFKLPLPNCPKLLLPQQYALSSEAMTQLEIPPEAICLIVLLAKTPAVSTATGVREFTVLLLPS